MVSLAGPVAGFALAGLISVAGPAWWRRSVRASSWSTVSIWVNVVWGVVHLLPVLPLDGGRVMASVELLRAVFDARPDDVPGTELARGLLLIGETDEAVRLADTMRARANTAVVVGRALFRMEPYADAARVDDPSFEHYASPVTAFNGACACARAGRIDNALSWLGRAVEAGFDSLAELDASPHLAAVREQPSYELIRRQPGAA